MKADIAGKVEYGTLLEWTTIQNREYGSREFWGIDHSARAIDWVMNSNLLATTLTHKFSPLTRDVT